MGGAQLSVLTSTGDFICHVPDRTNLRWQDECNTPGMGQFDISLSDSLLRSHPVLLDPFNRVRLSVDGQVRKTWLVEDVTRREVQPGDTDRWLTVAGRGVGAVLGNATIYPEYNLRRDSADERSFDYGSKDGGWRIPGDWVTPLSIKVSNPASIRKGYPLHWPDRDARWLWSTDPNAATPSGVNWFRGSFTLTEATRVRIFAAGDDAMWLQLDGEQVMHRAYGGWRRAAAITRDLAPGTHLIAAAVRHYQSVDPLRSGAFMCSVAKVDRNLKILKWLMRSDPASFKVHGSSNPPGWFAASILKTLVQEAQARGVEGMGGITFGFTDLLDSNGDAWEDRQDRSFRIGTTDLLDLVAQLTEHDLDVELDGDLVLQAWKRGGRGTDKTGTVRLVPGTNVLQAEAHQVSAKLRNRALVRHRNAWLELVDEDSHAAYGRRETGLVLGGTSSDSQATLTAQAAFADIAAPEITCPVTISSAEGPQPYADFGLFDMVEAPGITGQMGPHRVMSIAGKEEATGLLTYTVELYPEV